jgi:hypothetical protein
MMGSVVRSEDSTAKAGGAMRWMWISLPMAASWRARESPLASARMSVVSREGGALFPYRCFGTNGDSFFDGLGGQALASPQVKSHVRINPTFARM